MDQRKKRALMEESLARMVRELGRPGPGAFGENSWEVPTDIYETERAFIAHLDLAGVEPAAIQVLAEEDRLTVSGERRFPMPREVRKVHRLEIEQGSFVRRIKLPQPIEVSAVETSHRHGFLVIVLPKRLSRRVKVTVTSAG